MAKTFINIPDGTAVEVKQTPEQLAEEHSARLAALPIAKASLFRSTLRAYFGDNAELNRAVTAEAVASYFIQAPASAQSLKDAIILDKLFQELSAWNGTGETWTLFEQFGDLIP
jgi:hypothetical protein